ncbi:MAG TPA: glycosyltransferase [Flavobacteriaceae bacterium]|nr:glycosyltransferase [Flavobacteriaceae bacterium]
MTLVALIITLLYVVLIGSFVFGFDKVEEFPLKDIPAKTKFTVIVPFRNEAEHLPALLKSVSELNYPNNRFEFIFVDDDSSDGSVKLIEKFLSKFRNGSKVVDNNRMTNAPKKDAINTAVKMAKYDWIVTTDADCILPKYWLDAYDCFIQNHDAKCIVGPVTFTEVGSFFKRFQALDFLSLQGATIGGFGIKKPFLCNGANLSYKLSFFNTVNGFEGNTKIASGDDVFLLEKALKQAPKQLHYLKSLHAVVHTFPEPNLKRLMSQRKRWATKTSKYNNLFGKFTGISVLFMNALIICLLMFTTVGVIHPKVLVYTFLIKFCIDFLLLFKTVRFFNQEQYLFSYFFSSILYPFFSVFVAFSAVLKGYDWKGRRFRV